mmetsp:Transcript_41737/g.117986  ORF Transcript_41737/g.117986 Transcript_41737/m.117986 type:complete len:303 (-) Transcript_41737:836-1744(-)
MARGLRPRGSASQGGDVRAADGALQPRFGRIACRHPEPQAGGLRGGRRPAVLSGPQNTGQQRRQAGSGRRVLAPGARSGRRRPLRCGRCPEGADAAHDAAGPWADGGRRPAGAHAARRAACRAARRAALRAAPDAGTGWPAGTLQPGDAAAALRRGGRLRRPGAGARRLAGRRPGGGRAGPVDLRARGHGRVRRERPGGRAGRPSGHLRMPRLLCHAAGRAQAAVCRARQRPVDPRVRVRRRPPLAVQLPALRALRGAPAARGHDECLREDHRAPRVEGELPREGPPRGAGETRRGQGRAAV